jgi:thiol-disulfide isomerase/thioredoxin
MQSFQGRPLLVNFWATWCAPCVEELPLINDFYRQNKVNGWQVLGLAVDKLTPVQAFLQKMPLDFPVGMAGLSGAEMARALGNLAGGLPFSVVVGANGTVVQRKLGRLHPQDLAAWLRLK